MFPAELFQFLQLCMFTSTAAVGGAGACHMLVYLQAHQVLTQGCLGETVFPAGKYSVARKQPDSGPVIPDPVYVPERLGMPCICRR